MTAILPNVKTLSALVHDAILAAVRESILTKTTLRKLSMQDLFFNINDFLKPAALYCLVTKTEALDPNLQPAIISCQAQASKAVDIILSVNYCLALHTLVAYYGWSTVEDDQLAPRDYRMTYSNSAMPYSEWHDRLGSGCSSRFHDLSEQVGRGEGFKRRVKVFECCMM